METLSGKSYLVVGASADYPTLTEPFLPIDQIICDGSSLGVKELRAVLLQASQKPFGERRLLLIDSAESLTEVLQNTLLKTLEEPGAALTVVLATPAPESLLATVRSRLHRLNQSAAIKAPLPVDPLFLEKVRSSSDRETLAGLLTQQLGALSARLRLEDHQKIEALDRALRRLKQNCNQKLVIDAFLLRWPLESGMEN